MNLKFEHINFYVTEIGIMALFAVSFFVFYDFNIRMIFGYMILLLCILLKCSMERRFVLTKEKMIFSFLVAMISAFIIIGNSGNGTLEYAIAMDLCAVITVLYIPREKQYINAFKFIVYGSLAFSIYSILSFLVPSVYINLVRPHLSLGAVEYNDAILKEGYGVALGANVAFIDYIVSLAIIFSLSCYINNYRIFKNSIIQMLFAVIGLAGMLCVNRKGELLALIISVLTIFIIHMKHSNKTEKRLIRRKLICFLPIVILGVSYLASKGYLARFTIFFKRISRILGNEHVDITSGRVYIWKYAIELFMQHPIFGIGWEQFKMVAPEYDLDTVKVHNNFLQVLCETGVVGFCLIIIPMTMLLMVTFIKTDKCIRMNKSAEIAKVSYMISLGVQVYFFVLDFIDPCIYKMHFWIVYSIGIMSLIGACYNDSSMKKVVVKGC